MDKTILYVCASANSGKTTLIKTLCIRLLESNEFKVDNEFHQTKNLENLYKEGDDIVCVLKNDKIKIGISSMGDLWKDDKYDDYHKKHIQSLRDYECDMLILACRTFRTTKNNIEAQKDLYPLQYGFIPTQDKSKIDEVNAKNLTVLHSMFNIIIN